MSKPSVSVLMSVYNGEHYLQEAVESVLQQTYTDYEFIKANILKIHSFHQFFECRS